MTLYRINATLVHHTNDEVCRSTKVTHQIPTFLLDGEMLGIINEDHACQIARNVVCPVELEYEHVEVHVTAVRV